MKNNTACPTELFVKNMVCYRCKVVVETILRQHNILFEQVELGKIKLHSSLDKPTLAELKKDLVAVGFELLNDQRSRYIEQIKQEIIFLIHHQNNELHVNLSNYLSEKIGVEYKYLSNLFSISERQTIEKYFILQKIEKVKELMEYNELTLSEIAANLNYSSVAHLSTQFKKVTGITPSNFRQMQKKSRQSIDKL